MDVQLKTFVVVGLPTDLDASADGAPAFARGPLPADAGVAWQAGAQMTAQGVRPALSATVVLPASEKPWILRLDVEQRPATSGRMRTERPGSRDVLGRAGAGLLPALAAPRGVAAPGLKRCASAPAGRLPKALAPARGGPPQRTQQNVGTPRWDEKASPLGTPAAAVDVPQAAPEADIAEVPLRNRLGKLNRSVKAKLGKVARRGFHYGLVGGLMLAGAATVIFPVVGLFVALPVDLLVGATIPLVIVCGLLAGGLAEFVARRRALRHVAVADVVALERIYLELKERKAADGKLSFEDTDSWHKVNTTLESMTHSFWRHLHLATAQQFGFRRPCGRYKVGSIFAETLRCHNLPA